jgi:hypothetical protein
MMLEAGSESDTAIEPNIAPDGLGLRNSPTCENRFRFAATVVFGARGSAARKVMESREIRAFFA